jgi:hypothetical protein
MKTLDPVGRLLTDPMYGIEVLERVKVRPENIMGVPYDLYVELAKFSNRLETLGLETIAIVDAKPGCQLTMVSGDNEYELTLRRGSLTLVCREKRWMVEPIDWERLFVAIRKHETLIKKFGKRKTRLRTVLSDQR